MNDRVTFRLGSLAEPLEAYCNARDCTPSEAARVAIAKLLRVEAPPMDGHVETIAKVNAAKRTRARRGRKKH